MWNLLVYLVCLVAVTMVTTRYVSAGVSLEDFSDYDPTTDVDVETMTADDVLAQCGADVCPSGDPNKLRIASGDFPGKDKLSLDYKREPYECRCDDDCVKYNDCCVELFLNQTQQWNDGSGRQEQNPWRCNFLENHGSWPVWSLMVSLCPADNHDSETSGLCTGDPTFVKTLPPSQQYMIDLPIYSNRTKILYKNIFCARCHSQRIGDILKETLSLTCNHPFTPEDRLRFQNTSTYVPGKRIWRSKNITCQLSVQEFWADRLEYSVPTVRYCGPDTVQSCRNDKNATARTRALCSSYTQTVTLSTGRIFKNPHCFLCHTGLSARVRPAHLHCYSTLYGTKTVLPGGKDDEPVSGAGLNFLFDFNMFGDNDWVGYDMLCDDDEVWDYVRHDCHPMVCGKGHVLRDGACRLENEEDSEDEDHNHEPEEDLVLEPECFRILIPESEYTFVDDHKNGTLAVNLSTGGWLYLTPSEYEIWNDTTVTICAKFLHNAFESRFSPIFNYLSVGLVGLSVGFLCLHILLYILLPKLRNLPSNNLFCLTLSLFWSQLILLIFITATTTPWICVTAAIFIHYFFLSAFFWMNAMSFDIWRTFAGNMILQGRQGRRGGRGSFVKYSVFSWGVPAVIVSLAILTDVGAEEIEILRSIQPRYGQTGLCWISQRLSLFVFFALPVALVILSNLVLFSLTARAILVQNQESQRVLSGTKDSAKTGTSKSDEVLLKLYVKLALIMGLTWILGFVSAFLLWDWVWYAFVILNGLQGTFIFFAFDFKPRTFQLIRDRFGINWKTESSTDESRKADMSRRGTTTSSSVATSMIVSSTFNGILPSSIVPEKA